MHYVVFNMSGHLAAVDRERTVNQMDRKDYIKIAYGTKAAAITKAEELARANPGSQYAIMGIMEIREALKPAEPKLISKVVNEHGEIVPS